jgi:hypothetical protein
MYSNIDNVKLRYIEFCICVFNQMKCKDRWVVLTVQKHHVCRGGGAWSEKVD